MQFGMGSRQCLFFVLLFNFIGSGSTNYSNNSEVVLNLSASNKEVYNIMCILFDELLYENL